jgi:phosphocarrier protein HPr
MAGAQTTFSTKAVISSVSGLHLRPASMLVKAAKQFDADIRVERGRRSANCKSLLEIITLCAGNRAAITVVAQGSDAEAAVRTIEKTLAGALLGDSAA